MDRDDPALIRELLEINKNVDRLLAERDALRTERDEAVYHMTMLLAEEGIQKGVRADARAFLARQESSS